MKLKIPAVLYREGFATLSEDKTTIRLSASSEDPCLRWGYIDGKLKDYWEVLDHSAGGLDATRLKNGASLLFNHNRDIQLGTVTQPTLENKRLYVEARITKADDVASHRTRIEEGILKDTSVGYSVSEEGEEIGKRDGIPVYRFSWEPHEVSMVTIPADRTVGAGRSRELIREEEAKSVTQFREISVKNSLAEFTDKPHNAETSPTMKLNPLTATHFRNKDESGGGSTGVVVDAAAERNAAIVEFKARCKKIDGHLAAIKSDKWRELVTPIANKHKDGEADYEAFRTEANNAIDAYTSSQHRGEGDGASGVPSGIQVIGERGQQERLSIGQAFVRAKGFKEMQARSGQGQKNFGLDFPDLHCLGGRGKSQLAARAGWISSDLSSINVAPMQSLGNTQLGVQRTTILDLITPGTTDKTAIPYPVESSLGSINGTAVTSGSMPRVGTTAEGGTKPRWTPDLTTATAYVSKIAALATIPEEMLNDFSAIQSYVDGRLPYMVDIEAEFQVLYGDGLGTNIRGILSSTGVQTRAYATDWNTTIKKAITDIRVNSFFEPDGIAMHPYDWETASLEKDLNGQFLAGGPFYAPYGNGVYVERYTYCGLPVAVTTSVTATRPVVGAWKLGAQYFMREGMRVESTNSNKDDFERNMVTLRAEERLALAVYRPIAFLEITGGAART
jgi:HK97 family phage major capsid protein